MINRDTLLHKLDRGFSRVIILLVPILVGLAFFFITAHFKAPLWLSVLMAAFMGLGALAEDVALPWNKASKLFSRYWKGMLAPFNRSASQSAGVS